jgi:hypothetical protein
MTAEEVVRILDLAPHPEGGHFRETFRDPGPSGARAASTAIYYLLKAGETSRWHRVDAAEVWHHYAGAKLLLWTCDADGRRTEHQLGSNLAAGERPQVVIPGHVWQSARTTGAWTLCGCTVAPGFEFAGFELLPDGMTGPDTRASPSGR